jgi:hypothetical protein
MMTTVMMMMMMMMMMLIVIIMIMNEDRGKARLFRICMLSIQSVFSDSIYVS